MNKKVDPGQPLTASVCLVYRGKRFENLKQCDAFTLASAILKHGRLHNLTIVERGVASLAVGAYYLMGGDK